MFAAYLKLVSEFIPFKTISTDPQFEDEIRKGAGWLNQTLQESGFESEIIEGYGNPIVYATYLTDETAETVLIYGHYDVQPAAREDGWQTDPFQVHERNGRLYARGIVDNKGQFLVYLAVLQELIFQNRLKYNVKLILEGDEETGGHGIGEMLRNNPTKFAADFCLISDGEMPNIPVITASFRGIVNLTLTYKTANNSLHSGLFGGAVPNAAQELSKLISKFYDENYHPQIPDFYKNQIPMTTDELKKTKEMDEVKKELLDDLGIKKYFAGDTESFSAKIGFFTMLTVSGLSSGYSGHGYSNIVPNTATAKINFRIAAGQDPKKVFENFKKFVREHTPEYVEVTISEPENVADAIKVAIDSDKHKEIITLLENVYGHKVLIDYCGAIIPVVGDIKEVLGVEPILVSLANDDCNMHGVDENYSINLIKKALEFAERFFSQ